MSVPITTQLYTCLKASEGGESQKDAMSYLKNEIGMKVRKAHSPYVGQYGIEATGTEEQHQQAEEYLFG